MVPKKNGDYIPASDRLSIIQVHTRRTDTFDIPAPFTTASRKSTKVFKQENSISCLFFNDNRQVILLSPQASYIFIFLWLTTRGFFRVFSCGQPRLLMRIAPKIKRIPQISSAWRISWKTTVPRIVATTGSTEARIEACPFSTPRSPRV